MTVNINDYIHQGQLNIQEFILVTVMQMDTDNSQYTLTHIHKDKRISHKVQVDSSLYISRYTFNKSLLCSSYSTESTNQQSNSLFLLF